MGRGILLLCLAFSSEAALIAGQIYGTLRENGRGIGGAKVEIISGAKKPYSATTQPDGSYRVYVAESGRCSFRVTAGKRVATTNVFSSGDAVKYDFDLVNEKGNYILRRR